MLHEFHVLDKVMTGSTSDVKILLQLITSQMVVMQALTITDCFAEPHLLPVLLKIKKMLAKRPM